VRPRHTSAESRRRWRRARESRRSPAGPGPDRAHRSSATSQSRWPGPSGRCSRKFAIRCGEVYPSPLTAGERRAMGGLTQYALPGIIVLTSVGAFLMCLLVIRYGVGSSEIDVDDDEARRLAMTRIGHAVAAVCFAGAALLAVVALPGRIQPRPQPVAEAPAPPA